MTTHSETIKAVARELGFSSVGITSAEPGPHLDAYMDWIAAGMHGEMDYLSRSDRLARRRDLDLIVPGARSLIVVAKNYMPHNIPKKILNDPSRGRISNYAWGSDYHIDMLPNLESLLKHVQQLLGATSAGRAYVDTGAIIERSHAQRAGIGFYGKNTLIIRPRYGSYFFVGEIISTAELEHDLPTTNPSCGTCTRCLVACPTSAFSAPYVLDSRRCISYLTIECKGAIPPDLRSKMGNWIYGCDICQEVCPWQRFSASSEFGTSLDDIEKAAPSLDSLLVLNTSSFRSRYFGTAIFRIGRDRLVRNACIAAGNSKIIGLGKFVAPLLKDPNPILRGHAAWALGRLDTQVDAARTALRVEIDTNVRNELKKVVSR